MPTSGSRSSFSPGWLNGDVVHLLCAYIDILIYISRHSRRGLILNMGSFSGTGIPSPMLATYAGTKAFLSAFTASLAEEVKDKGIDVQCLNTYFVVRLPARRVLAK